MNRISGWTNKFLTKYGIIMVRRVLIVNEKRFKKKIYKIRQKDSLKSENYRKIINEGMPVKEIQKGEN